MDSLRPGLHEKVWPEIVAAFRTIGLGDPLEFYEAIITDGFPMELGRSAGTLGELSPKPHPRKIHWSVSFCFTALIKRLFTIP